MNMVMLIVNIIMGIENLKLNYRGNFIINFVCAGISLSVIIMLIIVSM